jgi:hypothetical protein
VSSKQLFGFGFFLVLMFYLLIAIIRFSNRKQSRTSFLACALNLRGIRWIL